MGQPYAGVMAVVEAKGRKASWMRVPERKAAMAQRSVVIGVRAQAGPVFEGVFGRW